MNGIIPRVCWMGVVILKGSVYEANIEVHGEMLHGGRSQSGLII